MRFADIPGNEDIKDRLRQMVDDQRIPHAILLEGPEGVGKMSMARAFAQYVHCTNRMDDGEPCGECPSCRQHLSFNHIDTTYVFPVIKTDSSKPAPVSYDYIDQWREYVEEHPYVSQTGWTAAISKKSTVPQIYVTQSSELVRRMSLTSVSSDYKIVIMWLPELLNSEAANKLLKLIEEPFADTLFVMVSDNPMKILPTIYSRVQRLSLRRLPDEAVADYVAEKFGVDAEESANIAHIAEGNIVKAEELMSNSEMRSKNLQCFITLMRLAYQRKIIDLRKWANELAERGRDAEVQFYEYAIRMMRENFVYNLRVPEITYLATDEQQFSANFARFITNVNVEKLIATFTDAIRDISGNGNGKIINFDVAIKVILLLKQ